MNTQLVTKVEQYFQELSKIPRASGQEQEAAAYMADFAKEHGFTYIQDKANNVIMKKDASGEYYGKDAAPVILQAHLDMVCVPRDYDWSKGVQTVIMEDTNGRGRIMRGQDAETGRFTSLGADDGIGVAIIMGILDSKVIEHPPIIAIFTADEEAGMGGARTISKEDIQKAAGSLDISKARMINIDEETDGEFSVGCAGGVRANLILPLQWESIPQQLAFYQLSVTGLTGGHSGMEIDKKRANAHRLMGRMLDHLQMQGVELSLSQIYGGEFENAIAVDSYVLLGIAPEQEELFRNSVKEMEIVIYNEYNHTHGKKLEENMRITYEKKESSITDRRFTGEVTDHIITLLLLVPNDVLAMDIDLPYLVETSSNLGVVKMEEECVCFTCCVRSETASRKRLVLQQMRRLMHSIGGELKEMNDYPGWEYREESELRDIFLTAYEELFGKPKAKAIHAGLECGYFTEKLGGIDIIACGPTMENVHTVQESLYLDTLPRIIELLVTVLSRL